MLGSEQVEFPDCVRDNRLAWQYVMYPALDMQRVDIGYSFVIRS